MENQDDKIRKFSTCVRQLIFRYQQCRDANVELHNELEASRREADNLRDELSRLQARYNAVVQSKMLSVADGDILSAKEKVGKMLRTVNQCITLLSEEKNGSISDETV